jgi:hypothetical protein
MHGHQVIRRLIEMVRELREKQESCTCGGSDGFISRNAESVQG